MSNSDNKMIDLIQSIENVRDDLHEIRGHDDDELREAARLLIQVQNLVEASSKKQAACGKTCTTAHGDTLSCMEKPNHGGAHYTEDAAGRVFMWESV